MKIILYSTLLLFLIPIKTFAESSDVKNRTIKGKVIDKETKTPLEYATISFYSLTEKKIVDGTITDINGEFEIKISDDIYNIKIEYIS